jgi:hypothetical protein
MATTMITCGDHKQAPASTVCIHLAQGLSNHWHGAMVDGNEVAEDWLCPECQPHPWDLGLADWVLLCMHCIRQMQKETRAIVTIHDYTVQGEE